MSIAHANVPEPAAPLLLPPELTIDPPLTGEQLDAVREWLDERGPEFDMEPAAMAAEVAAAAEDGDQGELLGIDDEQLRAAVTWRIHSDDEAEWAMRHLAAATANRQALDAQLDAYIDRIRTWHAQARRSVDRDISFFDGHLQVYALRRRAASGGKLATLTLPSGRVATTLHSPAVEVDDDELVAAWAETSLPVAQVDELVQVKTKVFVGPLRKLTALAKAPTGRIMLTFDCGALVVLPEPDGEPVEYVGTHQPCPEHDDHDAEVVKAEPEYELHVVSTTTGEPVPGAKASPPRYTAKATPAL